LVLLAHLAPGRASRSFSRYQGAVDREHLRVVEQAVEDGGGEERCPRWEHLVAREEETPAPDK